jgi:hypothetical protein
MSNMMTPIRKPPMIFMAIMTILAMASREVNRIAPSIAP